MNPEQSQNIPEQQKEQLQVETQAQNNVQEPSPSIKSEENQANWKAFREQREAERKAKEEAERKALEKQAEAEALRAALEALTNKPSKSTQYEQDDIEESEEARIDRRVEALLKQREEKIRQEKALEEKRNLPNMLQNTYNDFAKVCTAENLDYLEYHYPEIAEPYKHLPDSFQKWSSLYKAVKRFVPEQNPRDMARMEKNLAKPGSPSSIGTTTPPIGGNSIRLSDEKKAANWERMQKALKGIS